MDRVFGSDKVNSQSDYSGSESFFDFFSVEPSGGEVIGSSGSVLGEWSR